MKSRQNFYEVPIKGAHFQVKVRSEANHLDFEIIFQNRLCIDFTVTLKSHVLLFHFLYETSK